MDPRDDVVGRLAALIDRTSPRRVLVVVRNAVTARWLASLLAEQGVVLGARIVELEGLLRDAALELAGEPLAPLRVLGVVRKALVEDPAGRYAAIAEQPSYQREVLRCFVELERATGGDAGALDCLLASAPVGSRDRAMIEVFVRFRGALAELQPGQRGWWYGSSLALVLGGHRRVSFLRRRAAAIALGFSSPTLARWEQRLLEVLGFERWDPAEASLTGARVGQTPLDLRLSCAGPEAEVAAVARLLRAEPGVGSVVLAPADAIPRWAARLGHRDVPVRAWVDRRARDTSTARTVRSLLRILAEPEVVRRAELEPILFGPAFRAWAAVSEALELDYPRSPNPGDLRAVWEEQRASSSSLATLADRIRGAAPRAVEALGERAHRYSWAPDLLAEREARVTRAHALLAATLEQIAGLTGASWSPASLRTLLDDWDLLGRAAIHGVESAPMSAARVIAELLGKARPELTPEELGADLDHALARAAVGTWEQTRAIGEGPPVWLLPYASAAELGRLPDRVILTGLDAHPRPPVHHGPVSEGLRVSLGLVPDAERFTFELRELDALVGRAGAGAGQSVIGSWRHRDGTGSERPPGPWIAGRQDDGPEQLIGVDAIALPAADGATLRPTSPIERALIDWADDPELRRRVEAIRTHDAAGLGPHTGELGVTVAAARPYSASALQRYAALPYGYFVERVIGLRERERPAESASALLATEQGQVVHRALEAAFARRLAGVEHALELMTIVEPLRAEVLEALALGYRKRAEHGQAEAIWASERDRWAVELSIWWERWHTRLVEAWGPNPKPRKPEPDVLIPSGFLLATEWSPDTPEQPFELDLGPRTIPFVGAVDRIEIDPLRQRLNVCDYKTGRPQWPASISAQLRAGVHLQLPLYALAVEQIARTEPTRLRLSGPMPVGALRLEYLQRPLPSAPGRKVTPQVRGFAPTSPLGVDASGQVYTVREAAIGFTLAFVAAIEAGRFPVLTRMAIGRGRGRGDRLHELARVVGSAAAVEPSGWALPPALAALPDAKLAREVVQ